MSPLVLKRARDACSPCGGGTDKGGLRKPCGRGCAGLDLGEATFAGFLAGFGVGISIG
jgi:hypothetical protein